MVSILTFASHIKLMMKNKQYNKKARGLVYKCILCLCSSALDPNGIIWLCTMLDLKKEIILTITMVGIKLFVMSTKVTCNPQVITN